MSDNKWPALKSPYVRDGNEIGTVVDVIETANGAMVSVLLNARGKRLYGTNFAEFPLSVEAPRFDFTRPEPAPALPVSNTTARLIDMLRERDAVGMKKYGVSLDRTDLTLVDWLQHGAEEMLDGAGYMLCAMRLVTEMDDLIKAWEERANQDGYTERERVAYQVCAAQLRKLMERT